MRTYRICLSELSWFVQTFRFVWIYIKLAHLPTFYQFWRLFGWKRASFVRSHNRTRPCRPCGFVYIFTHVLLLHVFLAVKKSIAGKVHYWEYTESRVSIKNGNRNDRIRKWPKWNSRLIFGALTSKDFSLEKNLILTKCWLASKINQSQKSKQYWRGQSPQPLFWPWINSGLKSQSGLKFLHVISP